MKIEKKLFEKFMAAFSVPVQHYRREKLLFSCHGWAFSPDPSYFLMHPYINGPYKVCYVISPDFILSGYISLPDNGEYLILGPATPYEMSIGQIENLLKTMNLPQSRTNELQRYFHYIPRMSSVNFKNMLEFLYMLICPENHEEPIHLTYQIQHFHMDDNKDLMSDFDKNAEIDLTLHNLIVNGKVEKVSNFFDSLDSSTTLNIPKLSSNTTRSLKNAFIVTCTLVSRFATEGGLDYQTALTLSDYYISKIETITSFSEIHELLRTMILDYTERVSLCSVPATDSATIMSIYKDIQEHIHEKIITSDIAKRLDLSSSYICHYFKEKTGKTLTQYIHEQKIKEAKYLLETSNLSLVLISEKLAFSSQQQFQLIFKKITGTTPNQYRSRKR